MSKSRSYTDGDLYGVEYLNGYSHGRARPFLTECVHTKSLKTADWIPTLMRYRYWHAGWGQWVQSGWMQANNLLRGATPVMEIDEDDERKRLLASARAKLFDSLQEEMQLGAVGVFAATLGQTIRSIRNPANVLSAFHKMANGKRLKKSLKLKDIYMQRLAQFNSLSDSRKLSLGLPRQLLQTGISGRLELKYGWEPFLADVHEFGMAATQASEAERAAAKQAETWRTCTRGKQSSISGKGETPSNDMGWGTTLVVTTRDRQLDLDYRVSLRVRPKVPAAAHDPSAKLQKAVRLASYAAQIGWELLPYSFVVDAIIPVGDFLENLGKQPALEAELAPYGSDNCLLQIHSKDVLQETYSGCFSSYRPYFTDVGGRAVRKEVYERYSRAIVGEPTVADVHPSTGLTLNRGINFACLVTQILLRDFTKGK